MIDLLKRVNWLYVLAYGLTSGGIVTMSIYLATETPLGAALGLAIMFGLLGAAAYAFHIVSTSPGWKWLAYLWWLGAGFLGWLALMVEDVLHPAIGLAGMFFAMAAVVMAFAMRRRAAKSERREGSVSEWRSLGTGVERDMPLRQDASDQARVKRDR
jgi:hypothetical protein